MAQRETFFRVISPEHLYASATVFAVLTFLVVSVIYIFLHSKKKRFRAKAQLSDVMDEWISELLSGDENARTEVPDSLLMYLHKPLTRQFVIDKLIIIKKNITGAGARNIDMVYRELGLIQDSVNKMKSTVWHKKARGIYELYMMDNHTMYDEIMKYTNHNNKFVRREAQAATIGFAGFDGLIFLNNLTNPMYEWQQLKLLEQLQSKDSTSMEYLPVWIRSENKYVVQFALKLAEVYQQFQVHDIVVGCLQSDSEKIRMHAITALGKIAMPETTGILKAQYPKETILNQRLILKQIAEIGSHADFTFLIDALRCNNDDIKLEAARAIVCVDNTGWQLLFEQAAEDDVLQSISKQVEKEMKV